jgi:hypothetical protein
LRWPSRRASYGTLVQIHTGLADHLPSWRDEEQVEARTGWLARLRRSFSHRSPRLSRRRRERNELIKSSWHANEPARVPVIGELASAMHVNIVLSKPQPEQAHAKHPVLPLGLAPQFKSPPSEPSPDLSSSHEQASITVGGSVSRRISLVDDHELLLLTRQAVRRDWSMGGWDLIRAMFLTSQTERDLFGLLRETGQGEEGDEGEEGDDGEVSLAHTSPVTFTPARPLSGWGLIRYKLISARLLASPRGWRQGKEGARAPKGVFPAI